MSKILGYLFQKKLATQRYCQVLFTVFRSKQARAANMAKTKLPKTKSTKRRKNSKSDVDAKVTVLARKQTELARVFGLKCELLTRSSLSYLEYIELREEICRLNALKEVFASEAESLGKC